MAVILPNEGKDYWNTHVMSGASLYIALLKALTVSGGSITALSTWDADLASDEASWSGYARQAVTLGATSNGIMDVPSKTFTATSGGGPTNCTAYALVAAASGSTVAICVWDLSETRDMSGSGAELVLADNGLFIENPGESS